MRCKYTFIKYFDLISSFHLTLTILLSKYSKLFIPFINNPSFDDSFRLENCEPIDCIKPSFEIYQSSLEYYFYVISYDNNIFSKKLDNLIKSSSLKGLNK